MGVWDRALPSLRNILALDRALRSEEQILGQSGGTICSKPRGSQTKQIPSRGSKHAMEKYGEEH